MKVYLASPFFNENEIGYVAKAEKLLRDRGFELFSPREHEDREHEVGSAEWSANIFSMDRDAINSCDVMVLLYHGNYSDSGTAWECGYAYGAGKPVIVVQLGKDSNLMIHEGCQANISMDQLVEYDFESLPPQKYSGENNILGMLNYIVDHDKWRESTKDDYKSMPERTKNQRKQKKKAKSASNKAKVKEISTDTNFTESGLDVANVNKIWE